MKIAAFYENIKMGAGQAGKSMENALAQLTEAGLENLYGNYTVIREDLPWLEPLMKRLGLGIEGLYGFFDFSRNPEEDTTALREWCGLWSIRRIYTAPLTPATSSCTARTPSLHLKH